MQCKCGSETVSKHSERDKKLEATYDECRSCKRISNLVWHQPQSCKCGDVGYFVVADRYTGEPEQEQCEFCYTNPNSVFYVSNNLGRRSGLMMTTD